MSSSTICICYTLFFGLLICNKLENITKKINYFINNLELGWCQGYMALKYHMEEALTEKGLNTDTASWCPPFALFSKKYYTELNTLDHTKIHDFSFIGSIASNKESRQWIVDFAEKYFTKNSIFINTDNDPNWKSLGSFDFSGRGLGYCPKNSIDPQSKQTQYRVIHENLYYFENMCKSKFVLCPAEDSSWSFRFYEVLMCKSIPIVENLHYTYRTKEESTLDYKYVLKDNIEKYLGSTSCDDIVTENTKIFENYHLLP
jgi:hypothetical protein